MTESLAIRRALELQNAIKVVRSAGLVVPPLWADTIIGCLVYLSTENRAPEYVKRYDETLKWAKCASRLQEQYDMEMLVDNFKKLCNYF